MWKSLTLTCSIVAAIGCKADAPAPATGSAGSGSPTAHAGRSGKIDLGTGGARPSLPSEGGRPTLSLEEMEARRKERMISIDTDGDGTVSDAERAAARKQRAETMHKRLDADGDGKLTPAELATSPVRRLDLTDADTNKDGEISVDELDHALQTRGPRVRWGRRNGAAGSNGADGAPGAPGADAPGVTPPR